MSATASAGGGGASSQLEPGPRSSLSFREPFESMEGVKGLIQDGLFTVDGAVEKYKEWVSEPAYLLMREARDRPKPHRRRVREVNHFLVKASKRGNDVYRSRVRERFDGVREVVDGEEFFDPDKKRGLKSTSMLMVTLEFDPNRFGLVESWKDVGEEFNRFMSNMRRLYGRRCSQLGEVGHRVGECDDCYDAELSVMRVWEAHESGYPHVHALLVREDGEWMAKHHNGSWRLSRKAEKDRIAERWGNGFVDVKTVYDSGKALNYVGKYLTKYLSGVDEGGKALKTLAMSWAFSKRAFSCSGEFLERVSALASDVNTLCIIQTTLWGERAEEVYLSCLGLVVVEGSVDGEPPPWSLELSEGESERVMESLSRVSRRSGASRGRLARRRGVDHIKGAVVSSSGTSG